MAARKNHAVKTGTMPQRWRDKIQTSMIINRLQSFVDGKVEMTGPQVTAALGLLKKSVPDVSEADVRVSGNITIVRKMFSGPANRNSQ